MSKFRYGNDELSNASYEVSVVLFRLSLKLKFFSLPTCTLSDIKCRQGKRTDFNHIPDKQYDKRGCLCKQGPKCRRCGLMSCCSCKCHQDYSLRFRFYDSEAMENLKNAVFAIVNESCDTRATIDLDQSDRISSNSAKDVEVSPAIQLSSIFSWE